MLKNLIFFFENFNFSLKFWNFVLIFRGTSRFFRPLVPIIKIDQHVIIDLEKIFPEGVG